MPDTRFHVETYEQPMDGVQLMTAARWAGLVLLMIAGASSVHGEEIQWRPAMEKDATVKPASFNQSMTESVLGRPIPIPQTEYFNTEPAMRPAALVHERSTPQSFTPIKKTGMIVRAQGPGDPLVGGVPPVPPPAFPGAAPSAGPFTPNDYDCGNVITPQGATGGVGGYFNGVWNNITNPCAGRKCLQSDHAFDGFISPVTNPMLFEDPRALTEFRPVFIYQQTPTTTPIFAGSDVVALNLQGRVALTEYLSFVIHQLGWSWMEVHDPAPGFESHAGFSELHLGPKITFLRNTSEGTYFGQNVMAAGLTFEIPVGAADVHQSTGTLSLRPYLSFAQAFPKFSYGRFNFVGATGYSLAIDDDRSDHFFLSAHLDFDVGNYNKIYPFIEMNYFLYTVDGGDQPLNFEGRNLYNFGSTDVSGNSDLSLAVGGRYKFNEMLIFGSAIEFTVLGRRDLMDFRLTFDMILRY